MVVSLLPLFKRGDSITVMGVLSVYIDWLSVAFIESGIVLIVGNDDLLVNIAKISVSLDFLFAGPLNLFKTRLMVGLGFSKALFSISFTSDSFDLSSLFVATTVFLPFLRGEFI